MYYGQIGGARIMSGKSSQRSSRESREPLLDRTLQRLRWASDTTRNCPSVPRGLKKLIKWFQETEGLGESFRSYTFNATAAYSSSDLTIHGLRHLVQLLLGRRAGLAFLRQEVSDEIIGRVDLKYYRRPMDKVYVVSTLQDSFRNDV